MVPDFSELHNTFYYDGRRLIRKSGDRRSEENNNRYHRAHFNGRSYQEHRLIWFMFHNEWPDTIDHIDGNGKNNTLENLRSCSQACNIANSRKIKVGSSKYKGVCFYKRRGNWVANIMKDRVNFFIGYYTTESEAAQAYNVKAKELFGDYALLNEVA